MISRILDEGIVDVGNQTIRQELFKTADISGLITALLLPCPTIRQDSGTFDDNDSDKETDNDVSGNGDES